MKRRSGRDLSEMAAQRHLMAVEDGEEGEGGNEREGESEGGSEEGSEGGSGEESGGEAGGGEEEEEDGDELSWSERKELLADQSPPHSHLPEDSSSGVPVPRKAFPWLSAAAPAVENGRSKFVALHLRFDMVRWERRGQLHGAAG